MQIKHIHIKKRSLFAFLSLGLMAFMSIGVGAVLYQQPTVKADADMKTVTYGINVYVSETGSDTTGDGTLAKPYGSFQKVFYGLKGDTNVCLLSDYYMTSAMTGRNVYDANNMAGLNKDNSSTPCSFNVLITSASPTTGLPLTNDPGDFGSDSEGNKVFSVFRGTPTDYCVRDLFYFNLPAAYTVTFRNIIIDGASIQHYKSRESSGLIVWGTSACGPLVLSTNCVLQNNLSYTSSNTDTRGSAIYGSSYGKLYMESNATIRNCHGGGDGAVLFLGGGSSTFDSSFMKMSDNALITGCGCVQPSGTTPGQGLVIRTDFSLIMTGNAQIVNNFSTVGGLYNNEQPRMSVVFSLGHGVLLGGNSRICNNFFRYYSSGALTDWYDGNLSINTNGYVHIESALGSLAKIGVNFAGNTVSTSFIVADSYDVNTYQATSSDAEAFFYDKNPATSSVNYGFSCNATSHQINPATLSKTLALSTGTEKPHVDAKTGPIFIPFDSGTDLTSMDARAITVRLDDTFTTPNDISDCTFDSSTKVLSVSIAQSISSSAVVKVRVAVNGYLVNSNNWIDITNNIPYTVSFHCNGGSAIDDVSVVKGAACARPSNPYRTGYVFEAWYSDSYFLTPYVFSSIVSADTTLFAKWTLVQDVTALSLSINYSTSEILGFDIEQPTVFDNYYSLSQDMSSKVKITAPFLKIDESWYGKNVYFQKISTSEYYNSGSVLALSILARGEAPTAGTISDPTIAGQNGSLVVLSTQEYSTDNGKTWTVGTGAAIDFASGSVILVRTAATTSAPYSKSTTVTIRTKLATPVLTANYATSILSGLSDGYAYSVTVDGVANADIPSANGGTYSFPSTWIGKTVKITMLPKDSTLEIASDAFVLNPTKPSAPQIVATAPENAGEEGFVNLKVGQKYQVSGSSTWNDVPSTVSAKGLSFPVGTVVTVVTAATATSPESESVTVTVPAYTWSAPTATIDYKNEVIKDLKAGLDYDINSTKYTASLEGTITIDESWFGTTISIVKRAAAGSSEIASSAQTIVLSARPKTPKADQFTTTAPTLSGSSGTVDVPYGYEYRIGMGEWTENKNSQTLETIKASGVAGTSVEIRVAATASAPCSASVSVTIPNYVQPTPSADVDYAGEQLTNLTAGAAYTLSYVDGTGTTISKVVTADSNGAISISAYLGYTINLIKNKTTTTGLENDSAPQTIVLAGRSAAPDGKNFPTTSPSESGATGTIKVPVGYEYYDATTSKWVASTSKTGDQYISTKAGVYFSIRTSATASAPASQSLSVSVPNYKQPTPNAYVIYKDNVISGLNKGEPYTIEVGGVIAKVNADSNGQIDISKYYGSTILLRKSAQQSDDSDVESDPQTITLVNVDGSPNTSSWTKSAPTTLGGQGSVVIPTGCEYYDTTNARWDSTNKTVYATSATQIRVRTSATDAAPASQETTVVIPAYVWYTPAPSVDYANGLLTGLVNKGTYSLNGVTVTASASGTLDISAYYSVEISLIKKAETTDGTQADSALAKIQLGSTPATPAASSFTAYSPVTKGQNGYVTVPTGYEFLDSDGSWNSTSGVAYAAAGSKVKIRLAATSKAPASASCEVTIPAFRWATPTATVDYTNEKVTGLIASGTYTINGNTVTADLKGEVSIPKADFGTIYYIIKLATTTDGSELDSNTETLKIADIPDAPKATVSEPENSGEKGSIIVDVGWRYSTDNGATWKDVSLNSRLNFTVGTVIEVQALATNSAPASKIGSYTIPKYQWATPTGIADYANDYLSGFIAGGTYTIEGKAVTADASGHMPLDSAYYGHIIQIVKLAVITDGSELASEAELITIGNKPSVPVEAAFSKTAPTVAGGYGTILIPSGYDYFNPYTNKWVTVTDVAGFSLSVQGNVPVLVRYSATSAAPYSDALTLYIPSFQWATPTATIDYKLGVFKGLLYKGTYTINGADATADENGYITIKDEYYGKNIAIIKKAVATDGSDAPSKAQTLTVKSAAAAPAVTMVGPTSSGAYGTVTLNSGMRYSLDSGTNWVSISKDNTAIFLKGNGSIYVQIEPSETEPASLIAKLTMAVYQWATPTASVDYNNAVLTGLLTSATYSINGVTYTSDKNGQLELDSKWYGVSLHIIKLCVLSDGSEIDSTAENLDVSAIPSAPITYPEITAPTGKGDVALKAGEEYSIDGGLSWNKVQSDKTISFAVGVKVSVRYAATSTSPASPATTLTITPYQQPTPNGVINYLDQILSGLDAGCNYTINNTVFTADSNGCIAVPETWYGTTLSIIKNATTDDGRDLASSEESVVVLPISKAPDASLFATGAADKLGGNGFIYVPSGYEYYDASQGLWIKGEAKVSLAYGVTLKVRLSPSKDAPRSEELTLSIPAYQEKTPVTGVNYPNAQLTGFEAFAAYSINGITYHADKNGAIAIDYLWYGTSLSIKKLAVTTDGSDLDSEVEKFVLGDVPAAPEVSQSENFDGSGSLSVAEGYEYSTDDGATWSAGTGAKLSFPAGQSVMVRQQATDETPAGEITTIVVTSNKSYKTYLPYFLWALLAVYILIRIPVYVSWHKGGIHSAFGSLFVPVNRFFNLIFFGTAYCLAEQGKAKPVAPAPTKSAPVYHPQPKSKPRAETKSSGNSPFDL